MGRGTGCTADAPRAQARARARSVVAATHVEQAVATAPDPATIRRAFLAEAAVNPLPLAGIGARYGLTRSTAHRYVQIAGLVRPQPVRIERTPELVVGIITAFTVERATKAEIAERFGCSVRFVNIVLQENGINPRSPYRGRRPTELAADVQAEIERLYVSERLSSREIAKRVRMSPSTVIRCLRKRGVPLRTYTLATKKGEVTDEVVAEVQRRYAAGESGFDRIANELGVGQIALNRALRERGITLPYGPRPGGPQTKIGPRASRRGHAPEMLDASELATAGTYDPTRGLRAEYKGVSYQADLGAGGKLLYDGELLSPTAAAHRITDSWSYSGFEFWRGFDGTAWRKLTALRDRVSDERTSELLAARGS